jgi:ribosome-associated protein
MTPAKLVKTVVAALEEIKARDIEVLDVRKITTLFDRMIIASGDSSRQTKAIANNVAEKVKAAGGSVYGLEGEETGEWVLVDLGDVLVHVMQSAARAHYNLEELWAEAKKIKRATTPAPGGENLTSDAGGGDKTPVQPSPKVKTDKVSRSKSAPRRED